MNYRQKVTLAVGALQLLVALPAAGNVIRAGAAEVFGHARAGEMSEGRGARMSGGRKSQGGRKRGTAPLLTGLWGGEHIRLEVSEGGATVEYDCAHGTVDVRMVVDRRGRFRAAGKHFEEHGGPVRQDEPLKNYPVRYTGQVKGGVMKLTVARADTGARVGTFTLTRGQEPMIVKCR